MLTSCAATLGFEDIGDLDVDRFAAAYETTMTTALARQLGEKITEKREAEMKTELHYLHSTLETLIEKRRSSHDGDCDDEMGIRRHDFLSILLKSRDTKTTMMLLKVR